MKAGDQFHDWTVLEVLDDVWCLCECKCGVQRRVRSGILKLGVAKNCGCDRPRRKTLSGATAGREQRLETYKRNADKRDLEWALSDEFFFQLITSPCHYCGRSPSKRGERRRRIGVDRVNNDEGYLPHNVVPCCWKCNRAKGSQKVLAFEAWLDDVARFRASR